MEIIPLHWCGKNGLSGLENWKHDERNIIMAC
jgi:hypothetical protein